VLVSSIRPIALGSWLVYVYNPAGKAQKFSLHWDGGARGTIYASDASGRRGSVAQELALDAFDSAYLRVERNAP
jgi:hypothetical protein